ncbi:glycosyltransferase family 4 protein [Catenovulum sp. SM1970]|uniref:glycosyltransferase family 4 protein n=1 Tax=Marinifaba aquimaris TaxID=2741323 RepID=UPI00157255CE|nr:glycosyltransferase family 4 protein [Marinifaba aquimaris]NTS76896.1 glycosyltransferase family 4 protein [Marinifaba aquimaris]
MNILTITNMWPSEASPWLGTFVKQQVSSIKETGIDNEVINIRSKKSGGNNFSYIIAFFKIFIIAFRSKYQIIHLQHWICWLLCSGIFWKKKVYTVHEGEFFLGGYRKFFISLAIKYCDAVIFVNHKMYQIYKKKYPSKLIRFIPCGVDTKAFSPQNSTKAKKHLSLDSNSRYLFFPASPNRLEKNAQLLQQWDEELNDKRYKILWGGSISYQDMPHYMNACDVLITLSHYESDGMVVKESLACGKPVISTDVGNSRRYISSSNKGKIIEPNLSALNQAINQIPTQNTVASLLESEYKLNCTAEKVVHLYREVLIK